MNLNFNGFSDKVVETAKSCVLDWIGCTLAGFMERPARILLELVKGMGGERESTIVGDGDKIPCLNAALTNGFMSHILEFDDQQTGGSICHGAATVIPAALAIAERDGVSGEDLITAIVLGYETQSRIGEAINPSHYVERQFHSTGTCGTFGAAAAVSKLLKLTEEEMVRAFGIAGTQAAGLKEGFGTMCKPFHPGKAAYNGVLAALLAQGGFTGPEEILEGNRGFCHAYSDKYDLKRIVDGFGEEYNIERIWFKMYPTCAGAQPAMDALLEIMRSRGVKADEITEIQVMMGPLSFDNVLRNYEPKTPDEAKFSLPYLLAVTALDGGPVGLPQLREERIKDPRTRGYAKKVKGTVDPELADKPLKKWTKLWVKTKDGEEYFRMVEFAKGTPENPMSNEELEAKFRSLASLALSEENVDKIIEQVNELEKMENMSELIALLSP